MPTYPDPTPDWLRSTMDPSVLDGPGRKVSRALLGLLGADDPSAQVLGAVGGVIEAPSALLGGSLRRAGEALPAMEQVVKEHLPQFGHSGASNPAVDALVTHLQDFARQSPMEPTLPPVTGISLPMRGQITPPEGFYFKGMGPSGPKGAIPAPSSPGVAAERQVKDTFLAHQQGLNKDFRYLKPSTGKWGPQGPKSVLNSRAATAPMPEGDLPEALVERIKTLGSTRSPIELQQMFSKVPLDILKGILAGS